MEATETLTVGGIAAVVGGVIGWFLNQFKTAAEIRKLNSETNKLKAEATKNEGELLVNLQTARKSANDAYVDCGRCMDELIKQIKADAGIPEIDAARDAFCRMLTDAAIPRLLDHVEWRHLERKATANPDDMNAILNDALADFKRIKHWTTVINHPKFTRDSKLNPLILTRRAFHPIQIVVNKFPEPIRNDANFRLLQGLNDLLVESEKKTTPG